MPKQEQRSKAEKLYLESGITLRALADDMRVSYDTVKRWSREGKWAEKRRQGSGAEKQPSAKEKQLNRLMQASDEIEEALQMAAKGIRLKMAEDTDGTEIADGKFRAGNLKSIAHAIDRQTKTRILLSSVKPKEGNKGQEGVKFTLEAELEEITE